MIKAYATALVLGVIALVVVIIGGLIASSTGRDGAAPGSRIGLIGKALIGALMGFGMGGLSAEFSPLDLDWQVSLLIALVAAGLAVLWVRLAVRQAES